MAPLREIATIQRLANDILQILGLHGEEKFLFNGTHLLATARAWAEDIAISVEASAAYIDKSYPEKLDTCAHVFAANVRRMLLN